MQLHARWRGWVMSCHVCKRKMLPLRPLLQLRAGEPRATNVSSDILDDTMRTMIYSVFVMKKVDEKGSLKLRFRSCEVAQLATGRVSVTDDDRSPKLNMAAPDDARSSVMTTEAIAMMLVGSYGLLRCERRRMFRWMRRNGLGDGSGDGGARGRAGREQPIKHMRKSTEHPLSSPFNFDGIATPLTHEWSVALARCTYARMCEQ